METIYYKGYKIGAALYQLAKKQALGVRVSDYLSAWENHYNQDV
jgi:hypothetical protein